MTAQLTLGGTASNIPAGSWTIGPSTVTGSKATPELVNVELESGVEKAIAVPPEASHWAAVFQSEGPAPGVVKVKTNLNASDEGYPCPAVGHVSLPLAGVKELLFKATVAPKVFQVVFF